MERWDAAEADFQRFYQLDLRDEVERAGVRRIWALINALPPEAAIHRLHQPIQKPENAVSIDQFAQRYASKKKEVKNA